MSDDKWTGLSDGFFRRAFQVSPIGVMLLDAELGEILDANEACAQLLGVGRSELVGEVVWEILPLRKACATPETFRLLLQKDSAGGERFEIQTGEDRTQTVESRFTVYSVDGRKVVQWEFREVAPRAKGEGDTAIRRKASLFAVGLKEVGERITMGASWSEIAAAVVGLLEGQIPGALCSLLRLDESTGRLGQVVGPSLPAAYNQAIEGVEIGDGVGSCGTAAFLGKQVIVEDIANDPLWVNFRELALSHGLRACWSSPILNSTKKVLGTFAIYYREVRAPSVRELEMVDTVTHLAGLVIEREEREQALRASEARLRAIFEHEPECVKVVSLSGQLLEMNPAGLRMIEAAEGLQVCGMDVLTLIHSDDRERYLAYHESICQGGAGELQFRIVGLKGTERWMETHSVPLRDPEGQIQSVLSVTRDVTERKRAAERDQQQARLLDLAQDAILVRDLEGYVSYCNQATERLFGWTIQELRGRTVASFAYPEPQQFSVAQEQLLASGTWDGELRLFVKSGREIVVYSRWTLLRDAEGQPKSVLVINTDITERKRLEQQFLRAQRMEGIGTLAGGIAHDLNNSLAPIVMCLELLRGSEKDPDRLELLETVEQSARHAAEMVQQVLSFARGVEGQRVELDAGALLQEIKKFADETFLKNIQVRVIHEGDLWMVTGDATQLRQVLMNLCVNARDAMPDGGELTLRAANADLPEMTDVFGAGTRAGKYVLVRVEDTGTGMAPELIEKIFDPFFTTKEMGKGTGLGLSTTIGIVRSHGGFMRVLSRPREGSEFEVYLPASPGRSPVPEPGVVPQYPNGKGELIMVVDDEPSVRQLLRRTLERFGYAVVTAGDGAEGLEVHAANQGKIKLILTDMMMPGMAGPAMIRALRQTDSRVPVIATSGMGTTEMMRELAALGVSQFLPKPFATPVLLERIRTVLTT